MPLHMPHMPHCHSLMLGVKPFGSETFKVQRFSTGSQVRPFFSHHRASLRAAAVKSGLAQTWDLFLHSPNPCMLGSLHIGVLVASTLQRIPSETADDLRCRPFGGVRSSVSGLNRSQREKLANFQQVTGDDVHRSWGRAWRRSGSVVRRPVERVHSSIEGRTGSAPDP